MDEIELEHRLTNIEGNTTNILEQLVKLNGKVARHEQWINSKEGDARELKGFAAGRLSIHKRDLAILGGLLAVLQFAVQFVPDILRSIE